ncbi:MAG: hypothetical protein R3C44_07270 [Chloroflexota bacterium]
MSFFVVEREWEGVSVGKPFDKMGQHASDTAEVIFDNVRVPATHMLGEPGTGFATAMKVLIVAGLVLPLERSVWPNVLWMKQSSTLKNVSVWGSQSGAGPLMSRRLPIWLSRWKRHLRLRWFGELRAEDSGERNTTAAAAG